MKRMFVILLLSVFALAACTEGKDSGKTEIRFSWWGDTARHEIYNAIADLFEKANPDVKVIREPATWADFWMRLSTQAAGRNAPTVFGMHPQFVSDYALRGVLADLEPFVQDGTIDTTYISDPVLDSGRVRGTLYGISQGVTFTGFIANMTLLERFGIRVPGRTEDWTWDEFEAAAITFTDATKAAGETMYFSTDWSVNWIRFKAMAMQYGGDQFTEDGRLGFEESVLINWFRLWNRLRDYGAIPDQATSTEDNQMPLEQRLTAQGRMAMVGQAANQLSLYQAAADQYDWDLIRIPSTPNQVARGEVIEGAHFAISNATSASQKEAAARFINFFINTEESLEIFLLDQGVPPNERLGEYIRPLLPVQGQRLIEFANALLPVANTATYAPLGASEIDQLFQNIGEQVSFGVLTPEDGAHSFMVQATQILERN